MNKFPPEEALAEQLKNLPIGLKKAREYRRFSIKESIQWIGIPPSRLQNYEQGKYIPSLPELESFAYLYHVSLSSLFQLQELEEIQNTPEVDALHRLIEIRNHIIQTALQIEVEKSEKNLNQIAQMVGVSAKKIKRYLLGTSEIPFDDLMRLSEALNLDFSIIYDHTSPAGKWLDKQKKNRLFDFLPTEAQDFVIDQENLPYIELAKKFKSTGLENLDALSNALDNFLNLVRKNGES